MSWNSPQGGGFNVRSGEGRGSACSIAGSTTRFGCGGRPRWRRDDLTPVVSPGGGGGGGTWGSSSGAGGGGMVMFVRRVKVVSGKS